MDRYRQFLWLLGGFVWVLLACSGPMPTADIQANTARGDVMVQAIERYRTDHQHHPTHLEVLVPAYLPVLPTSTRDQAFTYRPTASAGSDQLCFTIVGERGCCYLSRGAAWECPPGVRRR